MHANEEEDTDICAVNEKDAGREIAPSVQRRGGRSRPASREEGGEERRRRRRRRWKLARCQSA
jgi:hypothetical protein